MATHVYYFGNEGTDGSAKMKNLLGGKGANLAEMTSIGVPVPPGFTITTEICTYYNANNQSFPAGMEEEMQSCIDKIQGQLGTMFGDSENPLLVSVRSGARVSMPGMMDTVLNLGLNDVSVEGFARKTNNGRLAYDSYRRFIEMYANVVKGVDSAKFHHAMDDAKKAAAVENDTDLTVDNLKALVETFKAVYKEDQGENFPQDPQEQLIGAVCAVFDSWNTERAILYRKMENIPHEWGTAVNVQAMVFGNKGETSATGVAFTRNPSNGEKRFFGEYLLNAQGEDVVAGVRTPLLISAEAATEAGEAGTSLEDVMPTSYKELTDVFTKLENHYHDMQDIEFTIDEGKLFILQTRNGKRTGFAQVKIAVDMYNEGLIDEKTGLERVEPDSLVQLLSPVFNPADKEAAIDSLIGKGLNAGPGAATGVLALTSEKALKYKAENTPCVLVRIDTSPEDFSGMMAAEGVLTARGGATSHAAVVARQFGKPCVCGLSILSIDESTGTLSANGKTIKEGDPISIDGSTGEVFFSSIVTSPSEVNQVVVDKSLTPEESSLYSDFTTVMNWADKFKTLDIRTNADSPRDVGIAIRFGAVGIGLTRVEHMIHGSSRLLPLRKLVISADSADKADALQEMKVFMKEDFTGIFETLAGLPATIRLLDPPLHEFMPHGDDEVESLAASLGKPVAEIHDALDKMKESNPMLGNRGCRLGVINPEITSMQVKAILEAALAANAKGVEVKPEIMVPIVMGEKELEHQKAVIEKAASEVFADAGKTLEYSIGTMIELPRAALAAGKIAEHAEFFSFGTNDLTQTTFGISRDDAGSFLPTYAEGVTNPADGSEITIYPNDPFAVLDQEYVGELIKIAVERGRATKPGMKLGICGEHGGEPSSIAFCHKIGLDYVSCSPYRVPIARLAAAQAAIAE